MAALTPPVLSLPDPALESEGGVDPLSLQRSYERLADRILPAVTVRMSRIRFLTAMCLGALVCETFDDDAVAKDDVTPPWLVYEWFVIEAFARGGEDTRGKRIPGLQKAMACLRAQRQLSAAAYLKTPKVFGFTGIFRRLATCSKILDDQLRLDDGGWELLRAWERESDLKGLIQGKEGAGADLVRELRDAVSRGLDAGTTVPRRGELWKQLAAILHPDLIGDREGEVMLQWLRASSALTRETLDGLLQYDERLFREDEPGYLRKVAQTCSSELAAHLNAIDAYESLCRPVVDAFDLVRHLSTYASLGPISVAQFSASPDVQGMVDAVVRGCDRVTQDPYLLEWAPEVRMVVDAFEHARSKSELFDAVVAHHEASQRRKPPDGKRPWVEHARDNAVMVRPAYALPVRAESPIEYVHDYRSVTLCGFLDDTVGFS